MPIHRGSIEIFLGLAAIFAGILAIKVTDQNIYWSLIVLGAFLGSHGGISVSRLAKD